MGAPSVEEMIDKLSDFIPHVVAVNSDVCFLIIKNYLIVLAKAAEGKNPYCQSVGQAMVSAVCNSFSGIYKPIWTILLKGTQLNIQVAYFQPDFLSAWAHGGPLIRGTATVISFSPEY